MIGIGKILKINIIHKVYNFFILKYRGVKYSNYPQINGKIYIVSDKSAIQFGQNVRINSSLKSNPIGGASRTILFAKVNAVISIGDNVGISNSAIVAHKLIKIGNNVLIGGNCKIYDTDFHSQNSNDRINGFKGIKILPVIIEDGAFIGAHSTILKGVVIGKNSIVGAGSVVTRNIPQGEIWAGNPARFIKKLKE